MVLAAEVVAPVRGVSLAEAVRLAAARPGAAARAAAEVCGTPASLARRRVAEVLDLALVVAAGLGAVVVLEAAARQGVGVDRISFVDALRWLTHAEPGEGLPDLVVNPARPGRVDPRVIKRRPKNYPWMSKPRAVLRERLLHQGDTVEVA